MTRAADNFVISFAKIGTDWLIADVWAEEVENCGYNDILYNYDNRVASFNTWLMDSRETAELMAESMITSNAEAEIQAVTVSAVKQIGTYNSTRATAYAGTYSSSASSPVVSEFVNDNYHNFGSVNCMNFVSQCIYAGLGGNDLATEIATAPYPMDVPDSTSNRDGWYYANAANYNWTWTCADGFKYYAFGINSNSSYGLTSSKAILPAGSTSFTDAQMQSGSLKSSEPTVYDLPGAALSINWTDSKTGEQCWHAVIIWKATSLAFTGVQICENSPMRKGITLSDSGYANKTIYYIKPFKMVEDTSCGSRSAHTFVDGYLGCTHCDYTKLEVWGSVYNPLPVNTTLTLTGTANATCYRMAIGIAYENEAAVWTNYYNVSSFSKTYTFTRAGLYTITIAARDVTDVDQLTSADTHVYKIRIY